jgi:FAD/FMN-containing dehydrogenase
MIKHSKIKQLKESLLGRVVRPEDSDYDEVRTLYNAMIDKRPAVIAQCANVADVITAVRFGKEQNLDTAIHGGGHNGPGLALVNDGLVIDLSNMKGIRVDPEAKTVRVEPGCRWGEVDHTTHAFGLATVSGVIANTGVSGLTLGGGHGYLTRKYGLTIDNLLSADVVLADGSLVHASNQENPDLFWALRGGGGNFGVVTSFEYRLHPVDQVTGGPMFWPIDKLEPTLKWYRQWLPQAPRDVYAFYLIGKVPPAPIIPEELHERKVCGLMWCYTGPENKSDEVIQPARDVAEPLFEFIGPLPYPAIQSMFDDILPPGLQWYWKGDFISEIPDEAISEHARFGEVPTTLSTMHLYPIDGAAHDIKTDESAWFHRDANWSMVMAGIDPDPANNEKITQWAKDYWKALHPYSTGGAYVNFMMEEGEDRIKATYGDNYEKLRKIKAKYDPDNFFHVNQNIKPKA